MASRLFRTMIGVGIALAAVNAGCTGQVEERAGATAAPPPIGDDAGAHLQPSPRQAPVFRTPSGNPVGPGQFDTPDAAEAADGSDAGTDASALAQAFCDYPWPTTKGGTRQQATPPQCVDPLALCNDGMMDLSASCPDPAASTTWSCTTGYYSAFPVCLQGTWVCPTSAWTCWNGPNGVEIGPPGTIPPPADAGGD